MLGEDSRFVFEMGEDGLTVFYVLQILNGASSPVQPAKPVVFELPATARGAAAARRLVAAGEGRGAPPGDCRTVRAGRHAGAGRLHDPVRRREHDDRAAAAVRADARGRGRAEGRRDATELAADARAADDAGQRQPLHRRPRRRGRGRNQCCAFAFTGMPHHRTWPRNVALGARAPDSRRRRVVRRPRPAARAPRDEDRARASSKHGATACSTSSPLSRASQREGDRRSRSSYAARRRELVTALEQVYAALDDEVAVRPRVVASGRGLRQPHLHTTSPAISAGAAR